MADGPEDREDEERRRRKFVDESAAGLVIDPPLPEAGPGDDDEGDAG